MKKQIMLVMLGAILGALCSIIVITHTPTETESAWTVNGDCLEGIGDNGLVTKYYANGIYLDTDNDGIAEMFLMVVYDGVDANGNERPICGLSVNGWVVINNG